MTSDDLTSVPGLQEVHRRALTGKLGITSLRALADADQRDIYTALGGIRPRPSLTRIASWQDNARKRLSETTIDRSAWHTVASFAVIFAQRQVNGVRERRLEAEQTEMEPASEPRQWPGWDCGPLCDWMLGRLGLPENEADSEAGAADQTGTAAATATEPSAGPRPARARRAELAIDSGVITDTVRELELIRAGDVIAERPGDLVQPVRLRLTVSGGRSGQQLRAAAWFRRPGGPGWSPHEPVIIPPSGQAEFDLSSVPAGGHDVRLLAWATAPGATLAAVTLPRLIFRQETEHDGDPAVVGA